MCDVDFGNLFAVYSACCYMYGYGFEHSAFYIVHVLVDHPDCRTVQKVSTIRRSFRYEHAQ